MQTPTRVTISLRITVILFVLLLLSTAAVLALAETRFHLPRKPLLLILIAFVSLAMLSVGLAMHFAVVKPLRTVLAAMRNLRHGQDRAAMNITRQDEIGDLSREYIRLYDAFGQSRASLDHAKISLETNVAQRIAELRNELRRLEKTAHTDALTGLANRRRIDEQLQVSFQQALKTDTDLACLLIDVDNFKLVNDTLGHNVGDELLIFLGELLAGCIRSDDFAGRLGGDEFVVLLKNCDLDNAGTIAERIRKLFSQEALRFSTPSLPHHQKAVHNGNNYLGTVTPFLSIGVASLCRSHASDVNALLKKADNALYRAKNAGRNCVMTA